MTKPSFEQWLKAVDRAMGGMIGLTHSDIADWQWWDSWEAGTSPREAARDAIEADDTFSALGGLDLF